MRIVLLVIALLLAAPTASARDYVMPADYMAHDCTIHPGTALEVEWNRSDDQPIQLVDRYLSRGDRRLGVSYPREWPSVRSWPWAPAQRSTAVDNPELRIVGCSEYASPTPGQRPTLGRARALVGYGTMTYHDGSPSPTLHGWQETMYYDGDDNRWRPWIDYDCREPGVFPVGHFLVKATETLPDSHDGVLTFFERRADAIWLNTGCISDPPQRALPDSNCTEAKLTAPVERNPSGGPDTWRAQGRSCSGGLGRWETRGADGNIYWIGNDGTPPPSDCAGCEDDLALCEAGKASCVDELTCLDLAIEQAQRAYAACQGATE